MPSTPTQGGRDSNPEQRSGRYTPENVHLTQFRSRFNPKGPSRSKNCVPTSAVMALRLAGLDVPGADPNNPQSAIERARFLGSGNTENVGMNASQLKRMLERSGAATARSGNPEQVLQWAREGSPVVLFGNPDSAWGRRLPGSQYSKYDGQHAVTLSGYEPATGSYLVNDPLSRTGVIRVSAQEIAAYLRGSSGGMGMRVTNPAG